MRALGLPLFVFLTCLLAACGGGSSAPEAEAPSAPTPAPAPGSEAPEPPATFLGLWEPVANGIANADDIATFPDGSSVVVGMFNRDMFLNAGEADETLVEIVGSSFFGAIVRYEADGSLRWMRALPADGFASLEQVEVLPDGGFMVAGLVIGSATFAAGEDNETTLGDEPYDGLTGTARRIFVARYAADGSLVRVREVAESVELRDLDVYANGACVLGGYYSGEVVFGAGQPNERTLPAQGSFQPFVTRLAPDLSLQWVRTTSGADDGIASGVAAMPDGSVAACGEIDGTAQFGTGTSSFTSITSIDADDGWVARYSAAGQLIWVEHIAGIDRVLPTGIVGFEDGSVVMDGIGRATSLEFSPTKVWRQTLDFGNTTDNFFARYAENGELLWARNVRLSDFVNAIRVEGLSDGSFVLAGYGRGDVTLDPDLATERTLSLGATLGAVVARFDADGFLQAAAQIDGIGQAELDGLAVGADGSIYVAGRVTGGGLILDPGLPSELPVPTTPGVFASYVLKLSPDGRATSDDP